MKKISLILPIFLLLFMVGNAKAIDISSCSNLNQTGATYYLTQDIIDSSATTCMDITANNITLDCQGHVIDGTDAFGINHGIYSFQKNNITIKNCIISDWFAGIFFSRSDYNTLTNITANSNKYGLIFDFSDYNIISDSNLINNTYYDFFLDTDKTELDCHIELINITGTDNKPIVFYNSSVTIENWNNNASEIILCGADNSVINNLVMSHSDMKSNGLYLIATNLTNITNSIINNSDIAIELFDSHSNILTNITVNSNNYGFWIVGNSNILTNITANSNSKEGIELIDSNFTIIKNSKVENNSRYGIYVQESGNNLIYNNLFNNTNNFYFDEFWPIYSNNWNTTRQLGTRICSLGTEIGGNYWTHPNGTGYSDTCTDSDKDGFCDNPYILATNNTDYLALSDEFSCTCTDWSPQECINTHTRYYTRTCTPAGCDIEEKYEYDPTCFSEIYGTSSTLIPLIPILVLVGLVIYLAKSLTTGISIEDLIDILVAITLAIALAGTLVAVIWF